MSAHFHPQFPNSDIIRYQRAGREAASAACLGKQQSLWNLQNHAGTLLEHCRNLAGTEILREFSGKLAGILLVWNILLSRALLEPCPPAGTSWWSLSGTMPCCNLPALPSLSLEPLAGRNLVGRLAQPLQVCFRFSRMRIRVLV